MAGILRWNSAKSRQPLNARFAVPGDLDPAADGQLLRKMSYSIYGATESAATTPPTTPSATVIRNVRALQTAAEYQPLNGNVTTKSLSIGTENGFADIDAGSRQTSPSIALSKAASSIHRRSLIVRDRWSSKLEFLLAVVGYAVDLGNVWRFPTQCYKHGGGAFLLPWLITLLVCGLPMFYMELALGQFHRSGCISIWKRICPMFKGIGYGICFICSFIACYYNGIIAHAVFFVVSSFAWEVPWKTCNNSWNTDRCTESFDFNVTNNGTNISLTTPSEEYYLRHVLEAQRSGGFDDLGGIKPSLAACLLVVFVLVYFALWKGPKSSGKMVWVTATAPYFILTILLIRGVSLPGAGKGISYYLTPDFGKLGDVEVWGAAATQIVFSLGPGFGVLLALSSYNDFNNNCYRDALVTAIINCATSFFSGFVIFSTLGYMAELTNRNVSQVVEGHDQSLIFIVYPQAIATMSYSPMWAVFFFVMLITLGIDSTFSGIEALITGFCDEYPRVLLRRREIFVGIVIVFYYFGSLPSVTYGGQYIVPFLDDYGVSMSVLFIVMCEMIAVCWFYGVDKFSEDIRTMMGFYPGIYWRVCWTLCPVLIAILLVLTIISSTTLSVPLSMGPYVFPQWSVQLGWTFRMLSISCIPLFMLYMFVNTPGTVEEKWRTMTRPVPRDSSAFSCAPGGDPPPTQVYDSTYLTDTQHLSAAV